MFADARDDGKNVLEIPAESGIERNDAYGTVNSPDSTMYYACEGTVSNKLKLNMEVWRDRHYSNTEVLLSANTIQPNRNAPSNATDEYPEGGRGSVDVSLPFQQSSGDGQGNSFVRETINLAAKPICIDRELARKIVENKHKLKRKTFP